MKIIRVKSCGECPHIGQDDPRVIGGYVCRALDLFEHYGRTGITDPTTIKANCPLEDVNE